MGLIFTEVTLTNVRDDALQPLVVSALVDTGALHLCIPESIAIQLNLKELERRQVTIADGSTRAVPYVGPIKISKGNRSCFTGAMVLGSQVLLGAIPMEDMDLVARPATQDVVPNPASPNMPASVAMGVSRSR
ncbi:MAG: clan AA aspartic protease [Methylocystis sp.]|nr:clan AA aspartic protease [Methylocystis sp.]MCA3584849.1 clan AA aspartic protease [Methylocystis sp.]MCA3587548.1 clan AA aspartic protease [Methylocystis sp.]MCA3593044.1 clan AA aspartic protease [Methylocystis sp.]